MGKQVKKVCNHKPGEKWTDGCCSPKPLGDSESGKFEGSTIHSAIDLSFAIQPETQKQPVDAAF
ncbi:hypothetical protein NUACC21_47910 [Scytonema sp. NUACC21]